MQLGSLQKRLNFEPRLGFDFSESIVIAPSGSGRNQITRMLKLFNKKNPSFLLNQSEMQPMNKLPLVVELDLMSGRPDQYF